MKIAVIGGGVSGLAAAWRLAANGHQVDLYEKNQQIGGRMNQIKQDTLLWLSFPLWLPLHHPRLAKTRIIIQTQTNKNIQGKVNNAR